jgi:hypothetical protein
MTRSDSRRRRLPGWAVAIVMLAIAGGLAWIIYDAVVP